METQLWPLLTSAPSGATPFDGSANEMPSAVIHNALNATNTTHWLMKTDVVICIEYAYNARKKSAKMFNITSTIALFAI